jgi:hypothetical protein
MLEYVIVSNQDSDSDAGEASISNNTCDCQGMINCIA